MGNFCIRLSREQIERAKAEQKLKRKSTISLSTWDSVKLTSSLALSLFLSLFSFFISLSLSSLSLCVCVYVEKE